MSNVGHNINYLTHVSEHMKSVLSSAHLEADVKVSEYQMYNSSPTIPCIRVDIKGFGKSNVKTVFYLTEMFANLHYKGCSDIRKGTNLYGISHIFEVG